MTTPKKKIYLENQRVVAALLESQRQGRATVELCECARLIGQHLLGDSRYRGYSPDLQDDLVSEGLLKTVKSFRSFNPAYADKAFGWLTKVIEQSFWRYLAKHYRQINIRRDLRQRAIDTLSWIDPQGAEQLRERCRSSYDDDD